MDGGLPRKIAFLGDSKTVLSQFPPDVKGEIGFGLRQAQNGERHTNAKPLESHTEIVSDESDLSYRAVYSLKFAGRVVVLHCFIKKSKKGIATPQKELNLVRERYKDAEEIF